MTHIAYKMIGIESFNEDHNFNIIAMHKVICHFIYIAIMPKRISTPLPQLKI